MWVNSVNSGANTYIVKFFALVTSFTKIFIIYFICIVSNFNNHFVYADQSDDASSASLNETHRLPYSFPADFKFGVGTSAYQVEGAWDMDGKSASVWDRFVHSQGANTNGDIACDSYHKIDDDIALIKSLQVNTYRFSISWPRVLPNVTDNQLNPLGMRYYNELIDKLLNISVQPVVTLYHWDLPQVLQDLGGWTNPLVIDYFVNYARLMFKNFGDRVKYWTTFNEPIDICDYGYDGTKLAPAVNVSGVGGYLCTRHVLLAHARVWHEYNDTFREKQHGKVGIALNVAWKEPENQDELDASERAMQFELGRFAHPIYSTEGNYPEVVRFTVQMVSILQGFDRSRLPEFTVDEIDFIRGTYDYFGLNHYRTQLVRGMANIPTSPSVTTDAMVETWVDPTWPVINENTIAAASIVPWGLRKCVKWISDHYGSDVEIVIMENGAPSLDQLDDYQRIVYLNEYLQELLVAIHEDGANVTGYHVWSLMDNFQWQQGYSVRYGLFQVDFDSPNRTRTPKSSATAYKNIIKNHLIDFSGSGSNSSANLMHDDFFV